MTVAPRGDASSLFATPKTVAEHRADGSIVLRSREPLRESARCIGDWLEQWAGARPGAIFLAERANAEVPWTTVTYAQALRQVRAAASHQLAAANGSGHCAGSSDRSVDRDRVAKPGDLIQHPPPHPHRL